MKRIIFRLSLLIAIATSLCTHPLVSKVLIWDIGYTLFKPQKKYVASQIGYWDCFCVYFKHGDRTHKIMNDLFFDILSDGNERNEPNHPCNPDGHPLPRIMCDWFKGLKTSDETLEAAVKKWEDYTKFKSKRYRRLLLNTLQWMFDPWHFAESMKPIPHAIKLVKECARKLDASDKPANKLYILSNLDWESFTLMYRKKTNISLFKFFPPEHIYISAFVRDVKPHPSLYTYMIKRAKLKPEDCILIDDQIENITAAQSCGITGIHLKDCDYQAVRKELKRLGAL